MESLSAGVTSVKGRMKPAKKIPFWLWFMIAKSLGIKLHDNDKPVVSAILYIFTVGSATALFATNAWYSGYNIVSVYTKNDILDGTISIMVMSFFCGLGVYSQRLAYRLFIHPKFLDMLRLHSKTFMKINSAIVIFIILVTFVLVLNLSTVNYSYFYRNSNSSDIYNSSDINPCQVVGVAVEICQVYWISQVIFSMFFLAWNLLVAVVLVSVARTQTINIRRFLRELELDAMLLDGRLRDQFYKGENLEECVWMDDDSIVDCFKKKGTEDAPADTSGTSGGYDAAGTSWSAGQSSTTDDLGTMDQNNSHQFQDLQLRIGGDIEEVRPRFASEEVRTVGRFEQLDSSEEGGIGDDLASIKPRIMSTQEIMHKYWRVNMNVRLASIALQRWMCSITILIVTWSSIRLVYWLSHTPTMYGIFMFILPLLLLPILASSYAEVNYEGGKILQSILPLPERIKMFQYLYGQPLQMTVYGHAVSYGTIGTVVAGILAAFASKILLQEINSF